MVRILAGVCALFALALFVDAGSAQDPGKPVKAQMVKGSIKSVDLGKSLLVINQKLKNEVVDRELSILDTTQFVVTKAGQKKELLGKDGLRLLEGAEGSQVNVQCDKDVNVLKVTVTVK